jgi:hypothetical protein
VHSAATLSLVLRCTVGDAVEDTEQGFSVTLSADGNTAMVGGPFDNFDSNCGCGIGAAWVFTNSGGVCLYAATI